MPAAAILGAQWGDEGKGKIVDLFAGSADLVVRFQGGPNAGHTIKLERDGEIIKIVLHHIPSGLFHDDTQALMADGMVVNPTTLLGEMEQLRSAGFEVEPERLFLSFDANVILPVHIEVDRAREENKRGGMIGTTLRGVGPTYEDRTARRGIRFRDLLDDDGLKNRLDRLLFERNAVLAAYGADTLALDQQLEAIKEWRDLVLPFCKETKPVLAGALADNKRVLIEGAQGALLDLSIGTFPYVTSSHTTTGGIFVSTGMNPNRLKHVMGVTKAYVTRVGKGPFPSELTDEIGKRIAEIGVEFGATTGRPRRCGWLDLVALKHAAEVNAIRSFALTKLDVLSGLDQVALCTAYRTDSGRIEHFPSGPDELASARPELEFLPGWTEDIRGCTALEQLPATCRAFLDRISDEMKRPFSVISVGPERDSSIVVSEDFWGD